MGEAQHLLNPVTTGLDKVRPSNEGHSSATAEAPSPRQMLHKGRHTLVMGRGDGGWGQTAAPKHRALGDSVQAYPLCVVRCAMTHCVGPRCALCVVLWPLGCVVRCAMGHGCVVRCALGHAPRKTANVSQSLLLEQSRFCLEIVRRIPCFSVQKSLR